MALARLAARAAAGMELEAASEPGACLTLQTPARHWVIAELRGAIGSASAQQL